MLKKMMLLAMAVGALIAFAAPASASASTWDIGGVPIAGETEAEGQTVTFHGTLSSTKSGLKISCDATADALLWNAPGGAHGKVTLTLGPDPTPTEKCTVAVNVGGGVYVDVCHVEPEVNGSNWTITTSGTSVTIDDAAFTNTFTGCSGDPLTIPEEFRASDTGNAEGEVVGECIVFNNSGTFNGGSTIDGEVCATVDLALTG